MDPGGQGLEQQCGGLQGCGAAGERGWERGRRRKRHSRPQGTGGVLKNSKPMGLSNSNVDGCRTSLPLSYQTVNILHTDYLGFESIPLEVFNEEDKGILVG